MPQTMKIDELRGYLDQFPKSEVSVKGLGCHEEHKIRTETTDGIELDKLIETHFLKIKKVIDSNSDKVVYHRTTSHVYQDVDEDGEGTGIYRIYTRIQIGEKGKCITMDQYNHLVETGVIH